MKDTWYSSEFALLDCEVGDTLVLQHVVTNEKKLAIVIDIHGKFFKVIDKEGTITQVSISNLRERGSKFSVIGYDEKGMSLKDIPRRVEI